MSHFVYQCADLHRSTIEAPIGTARRMTKCECGKPARLVLGDGMYIAAAATPNKRQDVVAHTNRERRWSTDMDAYKRMRHRGLQPTQIDGSSQLEDRVDDQMMIEYAPALDVADPVDKTKPWSGQRVDKLIDTVQSVEAWDNTARDDTP